jgi:hypothetical protein
MSNMNAGNSAKEILQDLYRFLKGGQPTPEAADRLAEFLSSRDDLPLESWSSGEGSLPGMSSDVVGFAYEFFVSMGICRTSITFPGALTHHFCYRARPVTS